MANQFLALSLFIMLLSFFIILNAVSSFEDSKSQPVLNSLSMAFSSKEATDITPPGPALVKSNALQDGSTLDKIESLFTSQITAADAKQNRLGTMMYIRLPFEDFERAVRKSLTIPALDAAPTATLEREENLDVLPMLVSLLETQRDVTYKMDMLLNISQSPPSLLNDDAQRFAALNKSVSGLALKLEEAGLPKQQVTAGLKQGEEGVAELYFRRYQPFNPLGALDKATQEPTQTGEPPSTQTTPTQDTP